MFLPLSDLDNEIAALKSQQSQEIISTTNEWTGTKNELRNYLKSVKEDHKSALKSLKNSHKAKRKILRNEIKVLEKQIAQSEYDLKLLSNRGKLELILADCDLIAALKERWISAQIAKKLDYPIFMAVSTRGGKKNTGDYDYLVDADGSLMEFPKDHPQEGQLIVNQDLVNYNLRPSDLTDATQIPDDDLRIAEYFIRFAQEQELKFWMAE